MGWMWRALLMGLMVLALAGPASAVVSTQDDGTYEGDAVHLNFGKGIASSFANDTSTVTTGEQCIGIQPKDFLAVGTAGDATPVNATTTTPQLSGAATRAPYLIWRDAETSPAQARVKVPQDFTSGGQLRVLIGRTGTTDPAPAIDFQVFVNKSQQAYDTAATDQTPVQVSNAVSNGSPVEATLTVATDFASLAAGDVITIEFWRDDVNTSTQALELYYAEFCYNQ